MGMGLPLEKLEKFVCEMENQSIEVEIVYAHVDQNYAKQAPHKYKQHALTNTRMLRIIVINQRGEHAYDVDCRNGTKRKEPD